MARERPRADGHSASGVPPLVEAMMRSWFYPDSPARVELKQTHISYEIPPRNHIRLDTTRQGENLIAQIEEALEHLGAT
jgi:hypothetical protein